MHHQPLCEESDFKLRYERSVPPASISSLLFVRKPAAPKTEIARNDRESISRQRTQLGNTKHGAERNLKTDINVWNPKPSANFQQICAGLKVVNTSDNEGPPVLSARNAMGDVISAGTA